jgi:hypothetical protein
MMASMVGEEYQKSWSVMPSSGLSMAAKIAVKVHLCVVS